MEQQGGVVVIGAGHAGGELAHRLRVGGYTGAITLVGDEIEAPYQRPPLSKKYLAGELPREQLLLRSIETLARDKIQTLLGRRVTAIDRSRKRVLLERDESLPYDQLVLATGAAARMLKIEGAAPERVHVIRTISDIDRLRPHFVSGARMLVVGAGFIGLEAAAIGRTMGLEVSVVEAAQRPLSRVTSAETGQFFFDEHVRQGVRFEFGTTLKRMDADVAHLANGQTVLADFIVLGVGASPRTDLAREAGLPADDGVLVDDFGRTADPNVFAIGDCARRPMSHYDGRLHRLESVHNAIEGGKIVAAAILGAPHPPLEVPWFWSDQYDLKLQMAGLWDGYSQIVKRGSVSDRGFAHVYYNGSKIIAVDAVNRPADYLGVKRLMELGLSAPPDRIADDTQTLRDILKDASKTLA